MRKARWRRHELAPAQVRDMAAGTHALFVKVPGLPLPCVPASWFSAEQQRAFLEPQTQPQPAAEEAGGAAAGGGAAAAAESPQPAAPQGAPRLFLVPTEATSPLIDRDEGTVTVLVEATVMRCPRCNDPLRQDSNWAGCDECHQSIRGGEPHWRCRDCDYDTCNSCSAKKAAPTRKVVKKRRMGSAPSSVVPVPPPPLPNHHINILHAMMNNDSGNVVFRRQIS